VKLGRVLCHEPETAEIPSEFEFAARLAFSPAGVPSMRVEIDLKGLQGRQLKPEHILIPLRETDASEMPE
jgi:hypothetical protein